MSTTDYFILASIVGRIGLYVASMYYFISTIRTSSSPFELCVACGVMFYISRLDSKSFEDT
jgi:hypothetical protein